MKSLQFKACLKTTVMHEECSVEVREKVGKSVIFPPGRVDIGFFFLKELDKFCILFKIKWLAFVITSFNTHISL